MHFINFLIIICVLKLSESDCDENPILWKCCPFGQIKKNKTCVNRTIEFNAPPVWDKNENKLMEKNVSSNMTIIPLEHGFNCSKFLTSQGFRISHILSYFPDSEHRLQSDGHYYTKVLDGNVTNISLYEPGRFCLDNFANKNGSVVGDGMICVELDKEKEHLDYNITATSMLMSCWFIIMILVVQIFFPESKTMNFPKKVQFAYIVCLFVGFISLATLQIATIYQTNYTAVCLVLTFIIYFSMEAAFFWLTVLSFDIYRTFCWSSFYHSSNSKNSKNFAVYSVFAFGVPLILTSVLAGLQFGMEDERHYLLPSIGKAGSFLTGPRKLLYLYGPMLLTCCVNIVFYVMSLRVIISTTRQTNRLNCNKSQTRNKERFFMCIKLFLMTGGHWILEFLSYQFPEPHQLWYITDVYILLQGVMLFVIYVCNKKTYNRIRARCFPVKKEDGLTSQKSTSCTTSVDAALITSVRPILHSKEQWDSMHVEKKGRLTLPFSYTRKYSMK